MKKRYLLSAVAGIGLIAGGLSLGLEKDPTLRAIELEDAYFAKTGKYLQVLAGNKLPSHEQGTVLEKLGDTLDPKISVGVYDSPQGPGYAVLYEDNTIKKSLGKGPEAERGTYQYSKSAPSDTSTSTPR